MVDNGVIIVAGTVLAMAGTPDTTTSCRATVLRLESCNGPALTHPLPLT